MSPSVQGLSVSSVDMASSPYTHDQSTETVGTAVGDHLSELLNLEEVQMFMRDLDSSSSNDSIIYQSQDVNLTTKHHGFRPSTSTSVTAPGDDNSRMPTEESGGETGARRGCKRPRISEPTDENNNDDIAEGDEDDQDTIDPTLLEDELKKGKSGMKPALSYIALISLAIQSTEDQQRMVLGDIYSWVTTNFPYFRLQDRSWRNSIRHNLSLNECFIKAGRSENGKGNYWAIHPANVDDFRRGDFRRRRARRQVRRSNARLEQLQGHQDSSRNSLVTGGRERGHRRESDTFSYVPMSSVMMTDAEIIAMFGKVVLRTTRIPSEYVDASPGPNVDETTYSPRTLQHPGGTHFQSIGSAEVEEGQKYSHSSSFLQYPNKEGLLTEQSTLSTQQVHHYHNMYYCNQEAMSANSYPGASLAQPSTVGGATKQFLHTSPGGSSITRL